MATNGGGKMSSDMKCPFCNKPLQPTLRQSDEYWCENYDCPGTNIEWVGSQKLWQELICARKELEQSETCCTEWEKQALDYKAENIALSGDLERTRKALEIAVDALKLFDSGQYTPQPDSYGLKTDASRLARKALEQITALKQKDK